MSQIIKLSDNAANRIKEIMSGVETASIGVRVAVKSGGCAGMSYVMEYAKVVNPHDEVIEDKGVKVFIDAAAVMYLLGTEMVVISGCESGKGIFTGTTGDGIYGLKRAIAVSGAQSSLLSLWKVNDKATAAFMESFYRKLVNKEPRTSALASTQKEFRNHPIKAWRHPNVWAAFQLSGDWRPIDF